MSTATWLTATALALTLALAHNLDGPADHSADWPLSAELQALQASEAGTARREAAGQALCTASQGPQSEARWTPDGHLVCTLRRNSARVEVVKL